MVSQLANCAGFVSIRGGKLFVQEEMPEQVLAPAPRLPRSRAARPGHPCTVAWIFSGHSSGADTRSSASRCRRGHGLVAARRCIHRTCLGVVPLGQPGGWGAPWIVRAEDAGLQRTADAGVAPTADSLSHPSVWRQRRSRQPQLVFRGLGYWRSNCARACQRHRESGAVRRSDPGRACTGTVKSMDRRRLGTVRGVPAGSLAELYRGHSRHSIFCVLLRLDRDSRDWMGSIAARALAMALNPSERRVPGSHVADRMTASGPGRVETADLNEPRR